ncbi:MAG TPA: hypothetical protein VIM65_18070 [Cyclobacteriaceae bacterium]
MLTLRGGVLKAGASTSGAIEVNLPDAVNMKLYGKSYGNKPATDTGLLITSLEARMTGL